MINLGSGVFGRGGVGFRCGVTGRGFGGRGFIGVEGFVYLIRGLRGLIFFFGGGSEGGLGLLGGLFDREDFGVIGGFFLIGDWGVMVIVDLLLFWILWFKKRYIVCINRYYSLN